MTNFSIPNPVGYWLKFFLARIFLLAKNFLCYYISNNINRGVPQWLN
jgi:hypothetical protein